METVELTRDCVAVQIPDGTNVTLNKGTPVDITQTLGGTYTVRAGVGLFRVGGNDADALGKEVANRPDAEGGAVSVERVHEMLKNCFDPVLNLNIVRYCEFPRKFQLGYKNFSCGGLLIF